jgi:hypothetical protein
MNKEWKEKWIKALRSGKYRQAREALNSSEGMCCLGVLGDLAVKAEKAEWIEEGYEIDKFLVPIGDISNGLNSYLPASMASDLFGLTEKEQVTLADMNDGDGLSFKQIANYIEENL